MWVLEMRILGIDFSLNIREDVDVEENFRRCSAARARMLMYWSSFLGNRKNIFRKIGMDSLAKELPLHGK